MSLAGKKHHYAFFDESSKKVIRRAALKAIAIPGYQVPFPSREMPIARGWGTGGLQLTLSLIGKGDTLKVIDQGADDSVNAVNIKKLITQTTTDIEVTTHTKKATLIQSRHRIPEIELEEEQIMILQVPIPEPLRSIEPSEGKTKILHSEQEYSGAFLSLFEEIVKTGDMTTGADHPVMVQNRYVMAPSPIPRYDNNRLHESKNLFLFGAGREKKIYAVPPYTKVESLGFEDVPFKAEEFKDKTCRLCGAQNVFMDELVDTETNQTYYQCNDTSYCQERQDSSKEVLLG
ncbi:alpha-D-ribose 1-methylphosphonate 5-phosphate C-P-lyase PhnJ [Spirochaeta cellobiosiphila]|uniref:alpha-D-ribose 1-methylphosphonate 5-phosphate C-P-lyase PhnJ n=1 Tax=Spirochaeta cellobiosiphila TaxID=504483 RepID=UPI0004187505|nr:alpha-D-ribose 1-methylphosphonate 5-phosphate C-P-lyase PhnJ [Spirochaeta cellobiosiphila]